MWTSRSSVVTAAETNCKGGGRRCCRHQTSVCHFSLVFFAVQESDPGVALSGARVTKATQPTPLRKCQSPRAATSSPALNLFQLLEQDRHSLRRQLQALRSEAEARQLELQGDVAALASRLQQHDAQLRSTEREKAALVAELTDQNLRLAARLKEVSTISLWIVPPPLRLPSLRTVDYS